MNVDNASNWWKFLPLAWMSASVLYTAARWSKFSSIREGALYYDPWAQVSPRGRPLNWFGLSAELAIDPEFLRLRIGFIQSVVFFLVDFTKTLPSAERR